MSEPYGFDGSMLLFYGAKHSTANAARIREYFKTVPGVSQEARRQLVDDWQKRGFLTADDARQILGT